MYKYTLQNITKQVLSFSLLLLSIFQMGCKTPFSTREPEPPASKQSSWVPPTSPLIVLFNLTNAIAEKNVINYSRCLADTGNSSKSFRYIAEPSVARANPGLFDHWSTGEETNYLNQMLSFLPKDSTGQLVLKTLRENTFQDSVVLLQEYTLKMHLKCENNDCPRDMQGQAEFRLIKSAEDLWYIYLLSDRATGDKKTWSDSRAYFGK